MQILRVGFLWSLTHDQLKNFGDSVIGGSRGLYAPPSVLVLIKQSDLHYTRGITPAGLIFATLATG